MKFILCVPTHNEETIIIESLKTISGVLKKLSPEIFWEIVVADNASTDGTAATISKENLPQVSVCSVSGKGKGVAIRTVALKSDVDFFGFTDADLSADPESILPMLDVVVNGETDIVIGSRFLDTTHVHRSFFRTSTSFIFNILQFIVLGLKVRDTQCGLKLMNKRGLLVLRKCREDSWFLDIEFLSIAVRNNLKIQEMAVAWEEFRYKNRVGKLKVVRDGFLAIVAMFRIRKRLNKKNAKRSF